MFWVDILTSHGADAVKFEPVWVEQGGAPVLVDVPGLLDKHTAFGWARKGGAELWDLVAFRLKHALSVEHDSEKCETFSWKAGRTNKGF